jgi:hypothetical protein
VYLSDTEICIQPDKKFKFVEQNWKKVADISYCEYDEIININGQFIVLTIPTWEKEATMDIKDLIEGTVEYRIINNDYKLDQIGIIHLILYEEKSTIVTFKIT